MVAAETLPLRHITIQIRQRMDAPGRCHAAPVTAIMQLVDYVTTACKNQAHWKTGLAYATVARQTESSRISGKSWLHNSIRVIECRLILSAEPIAGRKRWRCC
jgi:hypothetical protein